MLEPEPLEPLLGEADYRPAESALLAHIGTANAATPLLTTKTQSEGGTIFVDGNGEEVIFKGIGW